MYQGSVSRLHRSGFLSQEKCQCGQTQFHSMLKGCRQMRTSNQRCWEMTYEYVTMSVKDRGAGVWLRKLSAGCLSS